jgi:uracil-DNA glycosylase family 4
MKVQKTNLDKLNNKIINCKKCPRLSLYIKEVSKNKVKRFKKEKYWGKPLTGFGDPKAELLIIGLAPAAHGGNRTGRMFTGDSSGDWLAKALYENGFSNKSSSQHLDDGYKLQNTYITAALRCAPPKNKPTRAELQNCSCYLKEELSILKNIKIIVCLGKIAFDTCCRLLDIKGVKFYHGNLFSHQSWIILCSYHPSKQNTQTGRLNWDQWAYIFSKSKQILAKSS